MPQRRPPARRVIRAIRVRHAPAPPAAAPVAPVHTAEPVGSEPELSGYELLEVRSHELEAQRARGGTGTPQPPDAETPLLFTHARASQPADRQPEPRSKSKRKRTS